MTLRVSLLGFLAAAFLFADGGAVQFRKQTGPLLITVFAAPTPLCAGIADVTVLVQNTHDASVVLDAEVGLTLTKSGESDIAVNATHELATNKLVYAAYPTLPSEGEWHLNVHVKSKSASATVDGVIIVLPRRQSIIAYWQYIALAPAGILLFITNQLLKRRPK